MKRFSERIGLVAPRASLQVEGMDDALRNSLWNVVYQFFESSSNYAWSPLAQAIAVSVRKVPADELPDTQYASRDWVKAYFYSVRWNEVYDIMEFALGQAAIAAHRDDRYLADRKLAALHDRVNRVLEAECSGFRLVQGTFAPITTREEVAEIDDALRATNAHRFQGAHVHLKTAVALLSQKPNPDYRNSIKESISSIESIVAVVNGKRPDGLAALLDAVQQKTGMHKALQRAFSSLYGYTSDEKGIRHALLDEQNIGFDEAKYMLVACSAFANFLIAKCNAAGLRASPHA